MACIDFGRWEGNDSDSELGAAPRGVGIDLFSSLKRTDNVFSVNNGSKFEISREEMEGRSGG